MNADRSLAYVRTRFAYVRTRTYGRAPEANRPIGQYARRYEARRYDAEVPSGYRPSGLYVLSSLRCGVQYRPLRSLSHYVTSSLAGGSLRSHSPAEAAPFEILTGKVPPISPVPKLASTSFSPIHVLHL